MMLEARLIHLDRKKPFAAGANDYIASLSILKIFITEFAVRASLTGLAQNDKRIDTATIQKMGITDTPISTSPITIFGEIGPADSIVSLGNYINPAERQRIG